MSGDRPRAGRWPRVLVTPALCAALAAAGGCVAAEPAPADWRSSVGRSLADVASDLAAVDLVVRHRDGVWSAYAVTVLTDAEAAVAAADDDVASRQRPPGATEAFARARALLVRSVDVVGDIRQRVAAGRGVSAALERRLQRLQRRVAVAANDLGEPS